MAATPPSSRIIGLPLVVRGRPMIVQATVFVGEQPPDG
jgi:hypothetical protein